MIVLTLLAPLLALALPAATEVIRLDITSRKSFAGLVHADDLAPLWDGSARIVDHPTAPHGPDGWPRWAHSRGGKACMVVVAGRRRPAMAYRNDIPVTQYDFPWMPGSMLVVLRRNVRHAVRRYRARGDGRTPHGIYAFCLWHRSPLFALV